MTVYLSGKITGDDHYREKFAEYERQMIEKGHIVLNPAFLPVGMKYGDYMRICKSMIEVADAVVLLPDADKSSGASHEKEYAEILEKKIINMTECEIGLFNKVTRHYNCTVEVLENTFTGDISVGWWENEEEDE